MSDEITGSTSERVGDDRVPRVATVLICTRGISSLGATMLSFGLDVWVYRTTGSYGIFAVMILLNFMPGLLLAPFIGMIVDRFNKRSVLIACELLSIGVAMLGAWAFSQDRLGIWSCAGIVLSLALAASFRWAALGVTVSMLVPRAGLGRANGLQQAFQGFSDSAGPIMGAAALTLFDLGGLLLVSFVADFVALIGILLVPAGKLAVSTTVKPLRSTFWADATLGFRWILQHPILRGLVAFVACRNLLSSVYIATFTPFLLSQASQGVLSVSWGLYGLGSCLMGAMLASTSLVRQSIAHVVLGSSVLGIVMILWGAVRHPAFFAVLAFIAGAQSSLVMASLQTVWQRTVPTDIQGRVFATRQAISLMLTPFGILASIPLATLVFQPLVGAMPTSVPVWTGPGANIGLMVSAIGLVLIGLCSWMAMGVRSRGLLMVPRPAE